MLTDARSALTPLPLPPLVAVVGAKGEKGHEEKNDEEEMMAVVAVGKMATTGAISRSGLQRRRRSLFHLI